jgi:hypothetical protein
VGVSASENQIDDEVRAWCQELFAKRVRTQLDLTRAETIREVGEFSNAVLANADALESLRKLRDKYHLDIRELLKLLLACRLGWLYDNPSQLFSLSVTQIAHEVERLKQAAGFLERAAPLLVAHWNMQAMTLGDLYSRKRLRKQLPRDHAVLLLEHELEVLDRNAARDGEVILPWHRLVRSAAQVLRAAARTLERRDWRRMIGPGGVRIFKTGRRRTRSVEAETGHLLVSSFRDYTGRPLKNQAAFLMAATFPHLRWKDRPDKRIGVNLTMLLSRYPRNSTAEVATRAPKLRSNRTLTSKAKMGA